MIKDLFLKQLRKSENVTNFLSFFPLKVSFPLLPSVYESAITVLSFYIHPQFKTLAMLSFTDLELSFVTWCCWQCSPMWSLPGREYYDPWRHWLRCATRARRTRTRKHKVTMLPPSFVRIKTKAYDCCRYREWVYLKVWNRGDLPTHARCCIYLCTCYSRMLVLLFTMFWSLGASHCHWYVYFIFTHIYICKLKRISKTILADSLFLSVLIKLAFEIMFISIQLFMPTLHHLTQTMVNRAVW